MYLVRSDKPAGVYIGAKGFKVNNSDEAAGCVVQSGSSASGVRFPGGGAGVATDPGRSGAASAGPEATWGQSAQRLPDGPAIAGPRPAPGPGGSLMSFAVVIDYLITQALITGLAVAAVHEDD